MLYTAVVGADASIGPYKQGLSPTRFAGAPSQREPFRSCKTFSTTLRNPFGWGTIEISVNLSPCPNYGQHIIKV